MKQEKKIIIRKITPKQDELLDFIEKELPYGKGTLITHAGEPQRIENPQPTRIFKEKRLDNSS